LVRRVCRSVCDVREERPIGRAGLLFAYPSDRSIGKIFRQVIPLFWLLWWVNARCAVKENRRELVHLAAEEAVKFFEAASGRPAVERSGDALFPRRSFMTLAEVTGVVAVEL